MNYAKNKSGSLFGDLKVMLRSMRVAVVERERERGVMFRIIFPNK